ncbi:MAG: hypothetical protein H6839_14900 [Planctomycetes bacterium]|nr:hypothetical protein [Planctomycetota bacterium]
MRWSVWARIALSVVALSVTLASARADEEAYKPELPLVQLKLVKEKTTVLKPGQEKPLDKEALRDLLGKLAAYTYEDGGWKGKDERGISLNPLVAHIDAMTDYADVLDLVTAAAGKAIYQMVFGVNEQLKEPLKGGAAPDLDKLDAGYLHFDLPIDDGFNSAPALRRETLIVRVNWDSEKQTGSFTVGTEGSLSRVNNSEISAADLKSQDATKRDAVRDAIKQAITGLVFMSELGVDKLALKVNKQDDKVESPWVMVDLAYRACLAVNAARKEKKESALSILLPVKEQGAPTPDGPPEPPDPIPDPG